MHGKCSGSLSSDNLCVISTFCIFSYKFRISKMYVKLIRQYWI